MESQDAPTHVDLEDNGAHSGVLEEADIVQDLAENGAVVVLIDEVNLHTCKADVVRNTLVCEELGRDGKQRLEALFAKLGRVTYSSLTEKATLSGAPSPEEPAQCYPAKQGRSTKYNKTPSLSLRSCSSLAGLSPWISRTPCTTCPEELQPLPCKLQNQDLPLQRSLKQG